MKTSDKVRFGVIGCGYISQISHFPAINVVPEAELTAVSDVSEARAKESAEKWGARAYHTDYTKMLKRDDVDAVVIAAPNFLHSEMTIAAAEAERHVLCEKPIACTNKEAEEMVQACRKANVKLQIGHNQRFWSQNEIAKRFIQTGIIGDVMACRSTWRESWQLYPEMMAVTKFRYVRQQACGFAVMDLAIHRVDLIRWLVGNVRRVFGIAKRTVIPTEITVSDDNVWILCEFESGAYGCIDADRFSPVMSNTTELYGTGGTIYLSSETLNPFQPVPLALYSKKPFKELPEFVKRYANLPFWEEPGEGWITMFPPREDPYVRQMKHFVACILKDRTPLISGEEGAKALEVILATFKSMQTETWVNLPLKEEVTPPGFKSKQ